MPIQIAPSTVSFTEFEAIHQEQQRRRYPELKAPKPASSDSWKGMFRRWAVLLVSSATITYWAGGNWFSWVVTATVFSVLGLLYQRWEYRRAFRQQPSVQQPTSFTVEPAGITVHESGGARFFRWTDFYRVEPVQHWLLLYTSVEHCYYLNLDLVQPPATRADLLALLPGLPVPARQL
ncbi:YcxB family protein [Hymenobacter sp. BT175]|uniref:YcxB family protein n=1 Tax=Hymenobacter translucens TaxID=2886507 RepID=UPI001D0E7D4D|nr:YcxB family protein [Hymenobacter translucens]MCC2548144.1 YcxB family protein [Hymenobacter translucens]